MPPRRGQVLLGFLEFSQVFPQGSLSVLIVASGLPTFALDFRGIGRCSLNLLGVIRIAGLFGLPVWFPLDC